MIGQTWDKNGQTNYYPDTIILEGKSYWKKHNKAIDLLEGGPSGCEEKREGRRRGDSASRLKSQLASWGGWLPSFFIEISNVSLVIARLQLILL